MNIGERIYDLRTKKNLSQGDLAELLDVSRQSVSKWETGTASPDLDKIIKLSEIFGVSIDELVKGEGKVPTPAEEPPKNAQQTPLPPPQVKYVYVEKEQKFPARKIAAIILLGMGFILSAGMLFAGGGFSGVVFAVPFWVACFVCFAVPKHTAIWALWADYLIIDMFMRYATGANPAMIFSSVFYGGEFNMQLIFSWIWAIAIFALIITTAFDFRKEPVKKPKTLKIIVSIACGIIIAKEVIFRLVLNAEFVSNLLAYGNGVLLHIYAMALNAAALLSIVLFTFVLTSTVRLVLQHPKKLK